MRFAECLGRSATVNRDRLADGRLTLTGLSRMAALGRSNQDFCFATASRASWICFQLGANFSASSYFASAFFPRRCFANRLANRLERISAPQPVRVVPTHARKRT